MERTCSIAGAGTAADVTGMTRICSELLSRVDDCVCRIDEIHTNVANSHECYQLIDKVLCIPLTQCWHSKFTQWVKLIG